VGAELCIYALIDGFVTEMLRDSRRRRSHGEPLGGWNSQDLKNLNSGNGTEYGTLQPTRWATMTWLPTAMAQAQAQMPKPRTSARLPRSAAEQSEDLRSTVRRFSTRSLTEMCKYLY
jgi:hypothetical protein